MSIPLMNNLLFVPVCQFRETHNLLVIAKILIGFSIFLLAPILYINSVRHEPFLPWSKITKNVTYFTEINLSGQKEMIRKFSLLFAETYFFIALTTYIVLSYSLTSYIEVFDGTYEYEKGKTSVIVAVGLGIIMFLIYLIVQAFEITGIWKKKSGKNK